MASGVQAVKVYVDQERVTRLRTARGFTQAELAESLGMPASVLSRHLAARLPIERTAALRLADLLGCTVDLLGQPLRAASHTRPWLRAYADAPKKTVEQYLADTLLAVECFSTLRLKQVPDHLPPFTADLNDHDAIDDFALTVREIANVAEDQPVPNMTRAAERLGCLVLPMDNELGKHLGMSMFVDGVPVIRVSRPFGGCRVPGDRQRFTLAHELGHLTLHASSPPPETADQANAIEKQAHRFAGGFLLPGDAFLQDLEQAGGRVTLSTLSQLKGRWGVSIKAMVVRLQQLHRIDPDQARSLYKQISARGWNKAEPVDVGNETAVWLAKALARRFTKTDDPTINAVGESGLRQVYFNSWVGWDQGATAQVLDFPHQAGSHDSRTSARGNATVTRL